MKIDVRKKVMESLKGNFEVIKIIKDYTETGLIIKADFIFQNRKGNFTYTLLGQECGIDECNFDEKGDEDIYAEIHDWVNEHIEFRTIVKYDGRELK